MVDNKKGGGSEKPLREDPIVSRLVSGSTQAPTGLTSYIGLLGRSPNKGYWLLYLTLDMSLSVEIQEDAIVHSEQLSPDKSPFGSLGGTQIFVKKDAKVTTTRVVSRTHEAGADGDEFDLDIRLGTGPVGQAVCKLTQYGTTCGPVACQTNQTKCGQQTCQTCNQQTCPTCLSCETYCGTCKTECGQQTCGQQTCQTCQTKCGQQTCNQQTCLTCKTDCNTCNTCHNHATCFNTCADVC